LERLVSGQAAGKLKLEAKELLQDLQCVFCGGPGEYLVSTCVGCGDRAAGVAQAAREFLAGFDPGKAEGDFSALVVFERVGGRYLFRVQGNGDEMLEEKDMEKIAEKTAVKVNEKLSQENADLKKKLMEADQASAEKQAQVERSQKYGIGIKAKNSSVTKPSEYADVPEDQFGDPVNFRYPLDKAHVQAALSYFNQPDNRSDYSAEEQAKIMAKIVSAALAAGIEVTYQPNDPAYKALPEELKAKCKGYTKEQSTEERLAAVEQKVKDQDKLLEKYRQVAPGVELLAEPPALIPVKEAVAAIREVLPSSMVQRSWGLGPQRMCQELTRVIQKLEKKVK